MDLLHVSVSTDKEAEQMGEAFKKWWNMVTTRSGRVLREYRTSPPPGGWWVREDPKQGTNLLRDASQLQK